MPSVLQEVIASSSGALITALFMTPLDVVKIRLQAQTKGFAKGECFLYCNGLMDHVCMCLNGNSSQIVGSQAKLWRRLPNQHFTGTLDAFIKITRAEGIRSLWSGLPPTLLMAVPNTVVYYTGYDQLKLLMGYKEGHGQANTFLIPLTCGATARAASVTLITPIELIRTKVQSEQMTYKQIRQAVHSSVSEGGVLSLWRGWSPLMWRDVPFSAIYFTVYEHLKLKTLNYLQTDTLPTINSFINGAIGGMIAGVVTLPFDVVKTHRQIELGAKAYQLGTPLRTIDILRSIRHKHGTRGWFAGCGPRIMKVSPACAIMISTYEYCKRLFSSTSP